MIEVPAGAFTRWQQGLILKTRANERPDQEWVESIRTRQQHLVDTMREGPSAVAAYLRNQLGLPSTNLGDDLPTLPRELTPDEAFEPPMQLEYEIHNQWRGVVTPGRASQPEYWTVCHIKWIEEGQIGQDPVATFTRMAPRSQSGNVGDDVLEAQTRTFLRHVGGLPVVRGKVSVFSDCPLSRSWWRCRLAAEAAAHAPQLSFADAHNALHRRSQTWEELIQLLLRRLTVMNHPKARAAIIAYIASVQGINREELQSIAQSCARYGLGRSLHHASWDDVWGVIREAARS